MTEGFEEQLDVEASLRRIEALFADAEDEVRAMDDLNADPAGYPDALARSRALAERAQALERNLRRRYGSERVRRCLRGDDIGLH